MSRLVPDRWNLRNLRATIRHPHLIERELRTWIASVTRPLADRRWRADYGDGIDVIGADWDTLVVLDACRYDYMERRNTIEGDLEPVVSSASSSNEFVEANFVGRTLHDTVYVTANPYVEKIDDDVFYTVDNLLIDRWDEDLGTVPPEVVVEAALDAHRQFPAKRLIVHFMQPHQPYIGPTAREIRERVGLNDGYNKYQCVPGKDTKLTGRSWFGSVMQGYISHEELREVYRENVDIALEHAARLLTELDGTAVVTADHGELLGERLGRFGPRTYGHLPDCYAPELRVVPWLRVEGERRREVTAEDPIGFERIDQQRVNDRLQALGYAPE